MKNALFLFSIALSNIGYAADENFVACTSNFDATTAISPKAFGSVTSPIKLAKLVSLWGPAYRFEFSGGGIMYWRCTDGRVAMAGPVSDPNVILYGNSKQGSGNNWLAFISKNEAVKFQFFPITISIKKAEPGGPANAAKLHR